MFPLVATFDRQKIILAHLLIIADKMMYIIVVTMVDNPKYAKDRRE